MRWLYWTEWQSFGQWSRICNFLSLSFSSICTIILIFIWYDVHVFVLFLHNSNVSNADSERVQWASYFTTWKPEKCKFHFLLICQSSLSYWTNKVTFHIKLIVDLLKVLDIECFSELALESNLYCLHSNFLFFLMSCCLYFNYT